MSCQHSWCIYCSKNNHSGYNFWHASLVHSPSLPVSLFLVSHFHLSLFDLISFIRLFIFRIVIIFHFFCFTFPQTFPFLPCFLPLFTSYFYYIQIPLSLFPPPPCIHFSPPSSLSLIPFISPLPSNFASSFFFLFAGLSILPFCFAFRFITLI